VAWLGTGGVLTRTFSATIVVLALTAGSAKAATVTIGSSLSGPFTTASSLTLSTRANLALPSPSMALSPVDGTAISWSFVGSGLAPRVIRPTGGGLFTGAGTGTEQAGAGPDAISGPFPISLPVKTGDLFGIEVRTMSVWADSAVAGATRGTWPPLANGGTPDAPTPAPGRELAVQAVIRYCVVPKLKGLKPGKARQALTAADCTVGQVRKGGKRKKKRVIAQSVPPTTSIADTAPVDLTVSKKRKRKK
jgi:PASTA domain